MTYTIHVLNANGNCIAFFNPCTKAEIKTLFRRARRWHGAKAVEINGKVWWL